MITGTFGNFAHRNAAPASSLNDNGGEKTAEPLRDWLYDHGVRVRRRRTCEPSREVLEPAGVVSMMTGRHPCGIAT